MQAETEWNGFREAKDEFMRKHPQSPIPAEQRGAFAGLSYFPYNPELNLHLPLQRDAEGAVTMETSTGSQREYHRLGHVTFTVDGQPATLTVFRGEDGELFVPLRDATSGQETYGAGRYVEPDMPDEDTVDLDLNYLYNPYCAYNPAYSCPLPPMENWLRVPIRAGEKAYTHI